MKMLSALVFACALAGCSLKTQTVRLDHPTTDRVAGELKPVVIDGVTDSRDFASIPEASGPRIDPKINVALGSDGRAKAISGMPRGPLVTLSEDGPVTEVVRRELAAALQSHGYQVIAAADAPTGATHVRADVREFWAYMPISFGRSLTWTNQLKAWITTDVTLTSPMLQRQFTVEGHGAHIIQSYNQGNIKQAYDLALADFRQKLETKLFTAP